MNTITETQRDSFSFLWTRELLFVILSCGEVNLERILPIKTGSPHPNSILHHDSKTFLRLQKSPTYHFIPNECVNTPSTHRTHTTHATTHYTLMTHTNTYETEHTKYNNAQTRHNIQRAQQIHHTQHTYNKTTHTEYTTHKHREGTANQYSTQTRSNKVNTQRTENNPNTQHRQHNPRRTQSR